MENDAKDSNPATVSAEKFRGSVARLAFNSVPDPKIKSRHSGKVTKRRGRDD
jgi:hypothetical protein